MTSSSLSTSIGRKHLSLLLLVLQFISYTNAFSSTPITSLPTSLFGISSTTTTTLSSTSEEVESNPFSKPTGSKGRILILGGSGFLGQAVAKRAILEGYSVVSLSRRGIPPENSKDEIATNGIEYLAGDARKEETIQSIFDTYKEKDSDPTPFKAVIHCIGLLFDDTSGLGTFNRLVSGSGSIPEKESTYDDITRQTAFNAIEATESYVQSVSAGASFPFVFTSAAEAGWPDVTGGSFVESTLAPEWLRRYLVAKRAVEARLSTSASNQSLRPIIFRPSLIYSLDRLASLPPVSAFYIGNKIGLPFVDRPVTVQSLANAVVRSLNDEGVTGVQRFKDIDALNE